MIDRSNGYEGIAMEFLAGRGSVRVSAGIGVDEVRKWAKSLPPGVPITRILVAEGLNVFGVDAAPSFVETFRRNLPNTPIVCEAAQDSRFFDRTFDAVLCWGLMFLLSVEDQRLLIRRFAEILVPNGRLLFTSPPKALVWNDAMTERESRSLGAEEYSRLLMETGFSAAEEHEDVGKNHYFDAIETAAYAA